MAAPVALLLDIATIALAVLAAAALVEGGLRTSVGPLTLSMKAWWRVAFWAGVTATLRHLIWRHPSLAARIRLRTERWGWPAALHGALLSAGIGSRIAVLVAAYLATSMIGPVADRAEAAAVDRTAALVRSEPEPGDDAGALTRHVQTASGRPQVPAAALLSRSRTAAVPPVFAGVIFSCACFLWGLVYLYRLARLDLEPGAALGGVMWLAAWPFAVFFSVPGFDALAMLSTVAAFYHLRRDEPARAAAWGLVAGLASPFAVFLSLPLLIAALSRERTRARPGRKALALRVAASLMPIIAIAAVAPGAFHVSAVSPIERSPLGVLDLGAIILTLAILWPVARRFGPAYATLLIVGIVAPVVFALPQSPGRATASLFPVFLQIGSTIRPGPHWGWLTGCAMLQALVASAVFTGRASF